jgi:hypothetical protein
MKLPSAVLATRDRYVETFPLWTMPEGPAAEDRARRWTLGLVAQVVWEHGTTYGSKRADPNRPISKDGLAQQSGATLFVWDMLSGAGTGSPSLNENPDAQDITGQLFEHVDGRDVIGGAPDPAPTPPPASVPPYDESYSVQFGLGCNDVYTESGKPFDPGMISVHSQRAAWDYYSGAMSWDQSYTKHINEFRQEYGLPPV